MGATSALICALVFSKLTSGQIPVNMVGISVLIWFLLFSPVTGQEEVENEDNVIIIRTTSTTSDRTYTGKTYRTTSYSKEDTGTYTPKRYRTTTTSATATSTATPTSTPNTSSTSCSPSRETWDYEGELGPDNWGEKYPACRGEFQSPIDILDRDIMYGPNKIMLFINYDALPRSMTMKNDGHALIITGSWDNSAITPSVHFNDKNYRFQSIYFHWGRYDNDGSEHIFYREKWAMEIDLLHKSSNNELLVVGMVAMIGVASYCSPGLSKISDELAKVREVGNCTPIYNLTLHELVAISKIWNEFYWYKGSLTMPPCTENVDWCLGTALYCITEQQIAEFRKLNNVYGRTISGNVRKKQKMNGRFVQRMRQASLSRSFSVRESLQHGLATLHVTSMLFLFVAI